MTEFKALPAGLLDLAAEQLSSQLAGPSLIHLPGEREAALFVSVLLHGNETSGWLAVQKLLRRYGERLPRALSLLVGNVEAARLGQRRLDSQPDFNRVWPPAGDPAWPETQSFSHVVEIMRQRGMFAAVDVHNNTGANPSYACINRLADDHRALARLFSDKLMYFTRPEGVCSMAMGRLGPAVTVECGQVGDRDGLTQVIDFLDQLLHLDALPTPDDGGGELFQHQATVVLAEDVIALRHDQPARGEHCLWLPPDLERWNFRQLPDGTELGRYRGRPPLLAMDEAGDEVTASAFRFEHGRVYSQGALIASMLTHDTRVIAQDCFCHLLTRR